MIRRHCVATGRDEGSSLVEFVLVAPLVIAVGLGIVHISLAAYVRSTLISAASQGARAAALAGSDVDAARDRIESLTGGTLASGIVQDLDVSLTHVGDVVAVRIDGQLPGVSFLGGGPINVIGHAVSEHAS